MKLLKIKDYDAEIARIQHIITTTKNPKTKRDHIKCLKRLKMEQTEWLKNRIEQR